jgi:sec-independent protein translocase protein TatB
MLSVSFGEMMVVAAVGLIIIGPSRLPQTARFIGHLVARIQRQVISVKADIRREMELEDLKQINREYQQAAQTIKSGFADAADQVKREADAVEKSGRENIAAEAQAPQIAAWPAPPPADETAKSADAQPAAKPDSESAHRESAGASEAAQTKPAASGG